MSNINKAGGLKPKFTIQPNLESNDDLWGQGLNAIDKISKRTSIEVKPMQTLISPFSQNRADRSDPKKEQLLYNFGGYLKNTTLAGAVYASGLRMGGPLFKKAIDGRATEGQKKVLNEGFLVDVDNLKIDTLTGEGPKDEQSVYIPTGIIFSNVADETKIKHRIHFNTDPVDGTNPTSGYNLAADSAKTFAPGGTSIALFATPKANAKTTPSFIALPDELSVWGFSTPAWAPKVNLSFNGKNIEEMVEKNIKKIARACYKKIYKSNPSKAELAEYIKEEFKVAFMNRGFQNYKILMGLKNVGIDVEIEENNTGNVYFAGWQTDGDSLSSKHLKKGNVTLIGDGNVITPYMEKVHLFIGNSGGPEFLQLIPATKEIIGVFLSKTKRETDQIDTLITDAVAGSKKLLNKQKEEIFDRIFTEKDKKNLKKYGFDISSSLKVFNKNNLIKNSDDYITTFTAITPLTGVKGLFDVPGLDAVKVSAQKDELETSSIVAHSSGKQFRIKETFDLKTKDLKEIIKSNQQLIEKLDAGDLETNEQTKQYTKAVKEIISTYFDIAAQYIFFGCFEEAAKILNGAELFFNSINAGKFDKKSIDLIVSTPEKSLNYKKYMNLAGRISDISKNDLKSKEKLTNLKQEIQDFANSNLNPYLNEQMRKDLTYAADEIGSKVKKLK